MICDYQTNKVYLAEGIKGYPKVAENLLYAGLYADSTRGRKVLEVCVSAGLSEERQGLYSKLRWDDSEAGAELQADVARD